MTFDEAATRIQEQHLPDESALRLGLERIYEALSESSSEIASAFELGRAALTADVAEGGSVSLGASDLTGLYDLDELTVGGFMLRRVQPDRARLYDYVPGPPRYYVWERTAPGTLTIHPAPQGTSTVRLTVLREMPTATGGNGGANIWYGAYAPFHDLVTLKATAKLQDAQYMWEEAAQYMGRYQAREQEFAAHLQGLSKDVAMAMAARSGA